MRRFIQLRTILEDLMMEAIFEKRMRDRQTQIWRPLTPNGILAHLSTRATFDAVDYDSKILVQCRS